MRRRLGFVTATGACLAVVLAGCSDDQPAAQAPPAPAPEQSPSAPASSSAAEAGGDDAEVWVNGFCGAVVNLADLKTMQAPDIQPNDFAGSKAALTDLLGGFEGSVTKTLDGLNALGPAPEPAGDDAKQALLDVFTPVRDQVTDAKTKIDSATEQNPQPMIEAVGGLQSLSGSLTKAQNPIEGIKGSPALNAAGQKAPNCQKLAK
ncbi:hypothetical protein CFN78_11280 [Amycolatopsis antarctica]|uniref:Small secreted protein n=1 Tax=Amycolatopsis antarctica TaxID=1854586 RepID=A0A263D5U3_9PSEU|nr:hypothetical protein [Amycolatopsis antarctica]OZM73408.1 hypothetical protein CFN78_11280 [Amycolatopsis antarctica]